MIAALTEQTFELLKLREGTYTPLPDSLIRHLEESTPHCQLAEQTFGFVMRNRRVQAVSRTRSLLTQLEESTPPNLDLLIKQTFGFVKSINLQ